MTSSPVKTRILSKRRSRNKQSISIVTLLLYYSLTDFNISHVQVFLEQSPCMAVVVSLCVGCALAGTIIQLCKHTVLLAVYKGE